MASARMKLAGVRPIAFMTAALLSQQYPGIKDEHQAKRAAALPFDDPTVVNQGRLWILHRWTLHVGDAGP